MRRTRLTIGAVIGALIAALAVTVLPSGPVAAHGNISGPASRNYGCYLRWGGNHLDPSMATADPMCYQAWKANPQAMWGWNGLFREGLAGNHQGGIPDGTLCSGGRAQNGVYNAMDTVGNWKATSVGNSFTLSLYDQASHGADYIHVYVTKPGFNPVTTAPKWSDLDRVATVGNTPASRWKQVTSGVQLDTPVQVSGRTGRALVYTVWQASHLDQSYYFCSDVDFGGTSPTTPPVSSPPVSSPPVSTPPVSTPPVSTPPVSTPPVSTPPVTGGCSATYSSTSWQGGFQGNVTVKAGSAAIRGWTVTLTYPSGAPAIQQAWSATVAGSGTSVTATNVAFNGNLGAGASTSFGFIGSGSSGTPSLTCTATT